MLSAIFETGKPSWGKKTEKFFCRGVKEMTGLSIYKVSKKNATFYYKRLHFSFLCIDKEGHFT